MFVAVYRWRLKPGQEEQFLELESSDNLWVFTP